MKIGKLFFYDIPYKAWDITRITKCCDIISYMEMNYMKQSLIPKPEIIQKRTFNRSKSDSLKILTLNNEELRTYLHEQISSNPYLMISSSSMDVDNDAYLAYDHNKLSLYDELFQQLQLQTKEYDAQLCEYFMAQLDGNGYFKVGRSELLAGSGCHEDKFQYHLQLLHSLEPIGAFAFDLQDCLRIQCEASEAAASETALILCDYLEDLALRHFDHIMQETQLTLEEIKEGFQFIQHCNPKPTSSYHCEITYMMPEFKIACNEGEIMIQLLNDDLSVQFDTLSSSMEGAALSSFMRSQRDQAKHLMNCIQKRNMTLLQIMQYICDVQQDFFLKHGSLKHLTLDMVAQNCGLHISTVSRAITNKSFEFEHRYYPLKKMLVSGGVKGITQDEIKKRICELIAQEDKKHPYSDEAIRKELERDGIQLSRRAVTKYREASYIFNSNKRKER